VTQDECSSICHVSFATSVAFACSVHLRCDIITFNIMPIHDLNSWGNRVRNRDRLPGRNRSLRFEPLESRELLSAVGSSDRHVAGVSRAAPALHVVLAGPMNGFGILSSATSMRGSDAFNSSGNVIGPSTFDGSALYSNRHGVIKYTKGLATLANSSGDQVNVVFTGNGHVTGANFVYSVKGSVTGGTGADAGAAGTFSGSGTQSALTGAFSINIKIVETRE
jgi:hypothetical protein